MTRSRPVYRARTYHLIRRILRQEYRLPPTREVALILLYCLARASERTGVIVHAVCFMSNHVHFLLTDVEGKLPYFCEWFFGNSGRSLNRLQGKFGAMWEPVQTTRVDVLDEPTFWKVLAYILTNPVAPGLVRNHEEWGLSVTRLRDLMRERTFRRPKPGFRQSGENLCPAKATLKVGLPEFLEGMSRAEFLREARRVVRAREAEFHQVHETFGNIEDHRRIPIDHRPKVLTPHTSIGSPAMAESPEARKAVRQRNVHWHGRYDNAWFHYKRPSIRHLALFPEGTFRWFELLDAPRNEREVDDLDPD